MGILINAPTRHREPGAPPVEANDASPDLTGALHHVALRVAGYDEMKARLDARGADYQENFVAAIGLRQIFTADPNNVLLELNFFGE